MNCSPDVGLVNKLLRKSWTDKSVTNFSGAVVFYGPLYGTGPDRNHAQSYFLRAYPNHLVGLLNPRGSG